MGAAMSLTVGLSNERRLAGIASLSGWLLMRRTFKAVSTYRIPTSRGVALLCFSVEIRAVAVADRVHKQEERMFMFALDGRTTHAVITHGAPDPLRADFSAFLDFMPMLMHDYLYIHSSTCPIRI